MSMRKTWFAISALVFSFALMAGGLFGKASASLRCSQVVGCQGGGVCQEGGSVVGCLLFCTGGGTIECLIEQ